MSSAAGTGVFKFLKLTLRPQSADIKSAAGWGVATFYVAIFLVQLFDWIKKTFIDKPQPAEEN